MDGADNRKLILETWFLLVDKMAINEGGFPS